MSHDRKLDRRPQHDPRNANYPIRALVGSVAPRSYSWPLTITLDQGNEGACVGFAISHELAAKPRVVPDVTDDTARALYHRAQQIDEWDGEAYSGTSVLAGMKAAHELGYYAEYRWATTTEDLAAAVSRHGPAVLGIDWLNGFYTPVLDGGRWWLRPSGRVVGGHSILCRGYSLKLDAFLLRNSWGLDFADRGDVWIHSLDLANLLAAGGDACVPVVR